MTQKLLYSCAVENVSNKGVLLLVPYTGRQKMKYSDEFLLLKFTVLSAVGLVDFVSRLAA